MHYLLPFWLDFFSLFNVMCGCWLGIWVHDFHVKRDLIRNLSTTTTTAMYVCLAFLSATTKTTWCMMHIGAGACYSLASGWRVVGVVYFFPFLCRKFNMSAVSAAVFSSTCHSGESRRPSLLRCDWRATLVRYGGIFYNHSDSRYLRTSWEMSKMKMSKMKMSKSKM